LWRTSAKKISNGTLPKADLERLEDHLLICSECGDRLDQTKRYVAAIRAAAARIRERGTGE
jgi:hypothetical protein